MKKILASVIIVLVAVSLVGCDALQKKFTRKKKDVKPIPRLYQLKKYDIKPSTSLYSKHYSYWGSWMSELLQELGQNHKRDVKCVEGALSQLHDMQNILVKDKADALNKHIERIEEARDVIVREQLSQYNRSWVLTTLEREDRTIKRDFNVAKIKEYIRESFDDAPAASTAPAPSSPVQDDMK